MDEYMLVLMDVERYMVILKNKIDRLHVKI